MNEIMLYVIVGVLAMLIVVLLFVLLRQNKQQQYHEVEEMKRQFTQDLISFQNNVTQLVRQDLNTLSENTNTRLNMMGETMTQRLHVNMETTGKAMQEVVKQMTKIDQSQEQLKALSGDISGLHAILNDKKTRGIYGEIELYTLLESAYGDNTSRFAKQYKLSNGLMVDAVIFGNDALGMIPVDSKFPLENFNRLQDPELNAQQKTVALNMFKSDVKKHIQTIADKYIIPNETSDFAYMFIPAEAIFSYINANVADVIQYSYEKKVYLVSPTTLMAYITAIKALYLGQKKNEKMQEIQQELVKLSLEFERFTKRYEKVGNDFERAYEDMKDVLVTANKIDSRFKKIEAVELEDKE